MKRLSSERGSAAAEFAFILKILLATYFSLYGLFFSRQYDTAYDEVAFWLGGGTRETTSHASTTGPNMDDVTNGCSDYCADGNEANSH